MLWWVLVDRELRAAARRAGTWWWRIGGPLALCVGTLVPVLPSIHGAPPAFQGEALFTALTYAVWFGCWMAGVVLTADALARERREGTLGLLFLTDLSAGAVVAGKLASGSLQGLGAVVATLPLLALPMMLGGVSPGEWLRAAVVCLLTLWISLNAGLLCSAFQARALVALGWTLLVLVVLTGMVPVVLALGVEHFPWEGLNWLPAVCTPAGGLGFLSDSAYRSGPGWFWAWAGVQFALGLCASAGTRTRVHRLWRETEGSTQTGRIQRWRDLWRRWMRVRSLGERTRWLDRAPYAWRLLRMRGDRWIPWVALGSLVLLWVCIAWKWQLIQEATWLFLFVGAALLKAAILSQTVSLLAEDRRDGGAELVATSPQGPEGLWKGHWLALQRLWLWPLLLFTLAGCFFWWLLEERDAASGTYLVGLLALLWADAAALICTGTWLAVSGRSARLCLLLTFCLVWGIPWAIWSGATAILMWLNFSLGLLNISGFAWWPPWTYHGLRLVVDVLVTGFAWHQLQRHYRIALG